MLHAQTGYKGQKYVVFCDSGSTKDFILGWTNQEDGGFFKNMVEKHPAMSNLRIVECDQIGKPIENNN